VVGEVGGNLGESHARRASHRIAQRGAEPAKRNLDELHVASPTCDRFFFLNFTKLATSMRIIRAYIH